MKRALTIFLTICLMTAACSSAFASVAVSLEEIPNSKYGHMGNGCAFLSRKYGGYVLLDENGQEVNGDLYEKIYANLVGKGFMIIGSEGKIGVLWEDGKLILPCIYSEVRCYNDDWLAGKQEDTARYDICYKGTIIAHLDFDQVDGFTTAQPYGDYLYFPGSTDHLSMVSVDKNGNILQSEGCSYFDEYHHDYKTDLFYHAGSGQTAFVESCTLQPDEVECPYLADDRFILDLQGNILASLPEWIVVPAVRGVPFRNYFEIQKDHKKGLMDSQGNIILEPVYDEIHKEPNALGLFLVKKDDQILFVDRSGAVVQSINYAGSTSDIGGWTYNSPILVFDSMSGKRVFTACAGLLPESFVGEYSIYPDARLVVSITWKSPDGYQYGVMDVNGNMLVPFSKEEIEVNTTGTLVKAGDDLYKIVITNE